MNRGMTIMICAQVGLLGAALLAGCGAANDGDDVDQASAAVAANLYVISGATCGVVINPDSMHTVQLKYLLNSSGCQNVTQPTSHEWVFTNVSSYWQIRNAHSGLCMIAWGGQGGQVVQTTCTTSHEALWVLDPSPTGGQHLRNVHSGKCLNISGGPTGTNMIQWTCGTAADQFFNEDFFIKHAI